jgi:hypothetical protein
VIAHDATNFAMLIVGVSVVKLSFSVRLLIVDSRDYFKYAVPESQL